MRHKGKILVAAAIALAALQMISDPPFGPTLFCYIKINCAND